MHVCDYRYESGGVPQFDVWEEMGSVLTHLNFIPHWASRV